MARELPVQEREAMTAALYEQLHDHELLTPLDGKWAEVGAGVQSAFRACVNAALAREAAPDEKFQQGYEAAKADIAREVEKLPPNVVPAQQLREAVSFLEAQVAEWLEDLGGNAEQKEGVRLRVEFYKRFLAEELPGDGQPKGLDEAINEVMRRAPRGVIFTRTQAEWIVLGALAAREDAPGDGKRETHAEVDCMRDTEREHEPKEDGRDLERWMVDYEHEEGEPQHAVLSWVTPRDPTTALPDVGEYLVREYRAVAAEQERDNLRIAWKGAERELAGYRDRARAAEQRAAELEKSNALLREAAGERNDDLERAEAERDALKLLIACALGEDQDGYRLAPDLEMKMRAALAASVSKEEARDA
jgi:hypothetical protein